MWVSGGGTAEAAINPSECRSMPRTELLEEVRRSRQVLASLGSKGEEVNKEGKVQLAEQEADLMLLFAEHIEREEERKGGRRPSECQNGWPAKP